MKHRFLVIRAVFAEFFTTLLFSMMIFDALISRQRSLLEFVLRLCAAFVMGFLGIILVRSITKIMETREKMVALADSLKDANAELAHSNAQLQELDKQKSEFLTIAAHQLRTPLSIVNGYISLLEDGAYGALPKDVGGILKNMNESNQWLIRLSDEFLNIARLEQGRTKYDFASIDLCTLVDASVRELGPRAALKRLTIQWQPPAYPLTAELDAAKIGDVIKNFLDNSLKYSDRGVVKIEAKEENDGLALRVTDDGVGFDKHDELNLFHKFYRGENVRATDVNSAGLGLYVCAKFIAGHHGKIWAHSPGLGKGSEFGFWIPKIAPPIAITKNIDVLASIPNLEV